ncbi:MAG: response regulator [Bacteroidales bacterium]|nr:response regulator [Bacteroidales bacterium]
MKTKRLISLIKPFYLPIILYISGVVIVLYFAYNYKKNELNEKENYNLKNVSKIVSYIFPSSTIDLYYSEKNNEDNIIFYSNFFKRISFENNIESIVIFTLLNNDIDIIIPYASKNKFKELKSITPKLKKNFNDNFFTHNNRKYYVTYNITPYGQKFYIALIKNQNELKTTLKKEIIRNGFIGFILTILLTPIIYQIIKLDTRLNKRLIKKVQQRTEKLSKLLAEQKQTTIMLEKSLKENKELNEKLKETLNIKSNILTTLNHEIRNPLNVIVGVNSLFMQTELTPQQYELCKAVEFSAEKILNILSNLSQSSLIEKEYQIEHKSVKIPEIIKNIVDNYRNILEIKKIIIEIDYDINLPSYFESDETLLRQIFFNTLGYIINNLEDSKIMIFLTVEKIFFESNQILVKIIITTGAIINSNEQINQIRKFLQEENILTEEFNFGVNLTILKHIIRMLKGTINIYNDKEKGTTFELLFPFKIGTSTKSLTQIPVVSEKPKKSYNKLTILVAEDNELNQRILSQIITNLGHNVLLAKNGHEVIKIMKKNNVDLVFMDLDMPELNGLETIKYIKQHPQEFLSPNVSIVALTAYTTQSIENKCKEVGVKYFINKPINFEKIREILNIFT